MVGTPDLCRRPARRLIGEFTIDVPATGSRQAPDRYVATPAGMRPPNLKSLARPLDLSVATVSRPQAVGVGVSHQARPLAETPRPSAGPEEVLCEAAEIASGRDAPAHLCSRAERRGARPARSGPARVGRVHRAPGADRAGERGGTPAADDRARLALRHADGPQRRPRLQRRRPRGPDGRLVAAEERRPGPGRGRAGAAARDPAPAAARLRPRAEHLDPRPPGAGGARARAEPDRALGGDGPAGAAAAGCRVEAGQALADQPRPRLRAKKRRRDRLIGLARGRPGWAFGFADEVWFSRFAQPALHAWTAGEPLRLGMHAAGRDDPEPKALACYGLWLPERERRLLRFVGGGPGG